MITVAVRREFLCQRGRMIMSFQPFSGRGCYNDCNPEIMKKIGIFSLFVLIFALAVGIFVNRLCKETPGLGSVSVPQLEAVTSPTADRELTMADLRGKYVLVNFWDSSNAMSRIAAGEYDRFFRTHRQRNLQLVSVNTDENRRLFDEIVRTDGLDALTQYHIADVRARGITPDYHPEDGYSSYLINPSGHVVAVNPTLTTIENILHNSSH